MSLLNEMTPHAPATTIKKNAKPHKAEATPPLRVGLGALSIAEASARAIAAIAPPSQMMPSVLPPRTTTDKTNEHIAAVRATCTARIRWNTAEKRRPLAPVRSQRVGLLGAARFEALRFHVASIVDAQLGLTLRLLR